MHVARESTLLLLANSAAGKSPPTRVAMAKKGPRDQIVTVPVPAGPDFESNRGIRG